MMEKKEEEKMKTGGRDGGENIEVLVSAPSQRAGRALTRPSSLIPVAWSSQILI